MLVIYCYTFGAVLSLQQPTLENLKKTIIVDYDELTFQPQAESSLSWQHVFGVYNSTGIY